MTPKSVIIETTENHNESPVGMNTSFKITIKCAQRDLFINLEAAIRNLIDEFLKNNRSLTFAKREIPIRKPETIETEGLNDGCMNIMQ